MATRQNKGKESEWSMKTIMDDGGGRHRPFFDPRMALYDAQSKIFDAQDPLSQMQSQAEYGTAKPIDFVPAKAHGTGVRHQLNWFAIATAVFVPFIFFEGTFTTMSFSLYDTHPGFGLLAISGFFFATLIIGAMALQAKRESMAGKKQFHTWHVFIFLSCLVACCLGTSLGYINRQLYSKWYYQYISLRKVVGVEPGQMPGQQLLDAGEIDFKAGVSVDVKLHSFYQHNKAYCVAPIVPADGYGLAQYDLWAVGEDCCSAAKDSFSCGNEGGGISAAAGLRVINPDDLVHYRLAVQQAVVQHNLEYKHPIFLRLEKKPYLTIKAYYDYAKAFDVGVSVIVLLAQMALVGVQAVAFGLGVPSGYDIPTDPTHKAKTKFFNPSMGSH
jgi:hypothetical protein